MRPAWIQLECPSCGEIWESTLDAVPRLEDDFECPYCRSRSPVPEFVRTKEGLAVLRRFQG